MKIIVIALSLSQYYTSMCVCLFVFFFRSTKVVISIRIQQAFEMSLKIILTKVGGWKTRKVKNEEEMEKLEDNRYFSFLT